MEIVFPAQEDAIPALMQYVDDQLAHSRINHNLIKEYQLLVEEIAVKLINAAGKNAEIGVSVFHRLGGLNIRLRCPGQAISLVQENETDLGGKIIESFGDYLKQTYSSGCNYIVFQSSTTESNRSILNSTLGAIAAVVLSLLLQWFCTEQQLAWLSDNLFDPILTIFTWSLQAIATPVAFFTLAAFIISLRLSTEKNRNLINLLIRYFLTSFAALAIGFLVFRFYDLVNIHFKMDILLTETNNFMGETLKIFLLNAVSPNVIQSFLQTNPLPMLILGLLLGLAAGSFFGRDGELARQSISSISGLFCQMLGILYNMLPVILTFALLQGWLQQGFIYYLHLIQNLLLFLLPITFLLLLYAVQMWWCGSGPIRFIREYGDVLLENLKIGSNIQALPYNVRMLSRKNRAYKSFLEDGLKLGMMMNMDGNCIMVSTGIIGMMLTAGMELYLTPIIMMVLITILLYMGAPNQPGSFLLSMVVLTSFVGIAPTLYGELLAIEVFYGKLYSSLNAFGDIVTMALECERMKRKTTSKAVSRR